MTWLAPVLGGHHTTVAEALPGIARASVGAPTVASSAAPGVAAGQDASVPDGLAAVLALADAAAADAAGAGALGRRGSRLG